MKADRTTSDTVRKVRKAVLGTIYLLHFSSPYRHARHYLGWTENADLEIRLDQHMDGHGARLVGVVTEHGIGIEVARLWPGTRALERKLKNCNNGPRLCPICRKAKEREREQIDDTQTEKY